MLRNCKSFFPLKTFAGHDTFIVISLTLRNYSRSSSGNLAEFYSMLIEFKVRRACEELGGH